MKNYLYDICHGGDFKCPHCQTGLDVIDWKTEYGDPLVGEHTTQCPECNGIFELDVNVITTYTPILPSPAKA